ncbi:MAG: beta-glucuronidase [Clostridia bacterium]|nr:beta-glucuronidase [Clostridia bacterium]
MLYPQSNASRTIQDLSGIWSFRLRQEDAWESIAVPASYNDQKPDPAYRNHAGLSWYRTTFTIPSLLRGQRIFLRFDAVTHNARVMINGKEAAFHRGGYLPFEVDLNGLAEPGSMVCLEVEVDNRINHSTLPIGTEGGTAFFGSDNPGITAVEAGKRLQQEKGINLPAFDFFNYAGINRPVRLCSTPKSYIRDITIVPHMSGDIDYTVETSGTGNVHIDVLDANRQCVAKADVPQGTFHIDQPHLWEPWPGIPYLYTARITFGEDCFEQSFGVREVRIDGIHFLINEKPFHFHGPCKHEDSPFHGRGLDQCLNMTDINLYHWLGANCFRTSHYPYAEEMYALCDREGIVIVDETPAVGMWADEHYGWDLAPYHAEILKSLIDRDKNHPCVVVWSLGNEPNTDQLPDKAYDYWHPLYELAHAHDPQNRPVTLVGCQNIYERDKIIPDMDIVFFNRYYGWYNLSGDLETAAYAFRMELDWWADKGKPMVLSEYGADTIAGLHNAAPDMFSEEFQVEYYKTINACLDERPFIAGEMPWNFADFSTCQGPMRVGGNRKGLFTRDRRPKMAAHYFRERWHTMAEKER